jgi:hypothetical protein
MFVGCVGIWGAEDYVALTVVGNCDVLVATACLDGESSGVVSVELGDWNVHDVWLIDEGQLRGLAAWFDTWGLNGWFIKCGEYCKAI